LTIIQTTNPLAAAAVRDSFVNFSLHIQVLSKNINSFSTERSGARFKIKMRLIFKCHKKFLQKNASLTLFRKTTSLPHQRRRSLETKK
jgi:hypothetical protein